MKSIASSILLLLLAGTVYCQGTREIPMDSIDRVRIDFIYGNMFRLSDISQAEDGLLVPGLSPSPFGYWSFGVMHRTFPNLYAGLLYSTINADSDSLNYAEYFQSGNPGYMHLETQVESNGISIIAASLAYKFRVGSFTLEPGVSLGYSWLATPVATAYLKEDGGNIYKKVHHDGDIAGSPLIAPVITIRYSPSTEKRTIFVLLFRAEYVSGSYSMLHHRSEYVPPEPERSVTVGREFEYRSLCVGVGISIIGD